jgi:hypothetical protein
MSRPPASRRRQQVGPGRRRQEAIAHALQPRRGADRVQVRPLLPVGAIKRRLHVARNRLKTALEKAGKRARRERELACV